MNHYEPNTEACIRRSGSRWLGDPQTVEEARERYTEVLPEAESSAPYTGIFFDDPLQDTACIAVISVACCVLVALVPGPGVW